MLQRVAKNCRISRQSGSRPPSSSAHSRSGPTLSCSYLRPSRTMSEASQAKKPRVEAPLIITHSGSFHADEALAVSMLRTLPQYQGARAWLFREIGPNLGLMPLLRQVLSGRAIPPSLRREISWSMYVKGIWAPMTSS